MLRQFKTSANDTPNEGLEGDRELPTQAKPKRAMDIIDLSSDKEDEASPPTQPKSDSISAIDHQQAPIANEAPKIKERDDSIAKVEEQMSDVPKASIPNDDDSGRRSTEAANHNDHLLAEEGDVISAIDFTSTHNQDINHTPFLPNRPGRPEEPSQALPRFRKHKHGDRIYRTPRKEEEHEDSANNMGLSPSPPPSAGLLLEGPSFESPKPEREAERVQQGEIVVDLTKDEKDEEYKGNPPIHEVKRVPPNLNKAHRSEINKSNGNTSGPGSACGGQEESSKRQREKDELSDDEQPGNSKRAKKNETVPKKQESGHLRNFYRQTDTLREPPPRTKMTKPPDFGTCRPKNDFKTRKDSSPIIAKPPPTFAKHFDLSENTPSPAEDERYPKKQKTSHNGSEKDVSEMDTNEIQNHEYRRESTAVSGLSYPQVEKRLDNGRIEAFLNTENFLHPRRSRNRNQGSVSEAQTSGGAQKFKRSSFELQHSNGEDVDDPIQDEDSNHGKVNKKASTTVRVEISANQASGHKSNAIRISPSQEVRKSNVGRAREHPKTTAGVSPHFPIKRGQTLASGAKDPNKEFDELNEEYYPEDLDKKKTSKNSDVQELSSDDDTEMRGHIAPSKLNIRKGSRLTSRNGEKVYSITKAFSEKKKWLLHDSDAQWVLRYYIDTKTLILHDTEDVVVWTLSTDKLKKIEYTPGDPKIIFHKAADTTEPVGTKIHLELQNDTNSEFLRVQLKSAHRVTIGCVEKYAGYMKKTFDNTIDHMESDEKRKCKNKEGPAEDIFRISEKQRIKGENTFRNALSAKPRQASISMSTDSEATPKPSGIVGRMKISTRSSGVAQDSSRPETKPRPLQPKGEFYGFIENNSGAPQSNQTLLRPSGRRIAPRRAPSPSPPPPPQRWSLQPQNMSWQDDWKSSLIFPSTGKNKATVDKQDIERLDEGEFLNDNILVFYLRKLEFDLQTRNPDLAKRVYFQNPFFYERLTTNPPRGKKINYEAVERWTAKVNLFDYDYMIVPVNENAHWYVAIICNVKKFLELASPETGAPLSPDLLRTTRRAAVEGDHAHGAISPASITNETKGPSPTRLSDRMEDVSLEDNTNISKSKDHREESVEDVEKMSSSDVPGRGGGIPSGDDDLGGEVEEKSIVSDIVPTAHSPKPTPVSKAKQQKQKAPPARHVNTESPRIITLDSLGIARSPTCTNLKNYLLAEIKAKTGREARDPGKIGHTVKYLPQQDNYYDCGLFLLMYVEMFLEKGDSFIKDLIANNKEDRTDLTVEPLQWTDAPTLRANIRDLLFELQKKQVIENEKLQEQKRMNKEARLRKAQPKSEVAKKHKSATPPKVVAEEPADFPTKTNVNTPSKKNVTTGASNSDIVLAAGKKRKMFATDTISIEDPATANIPDAGDSRSVEASHGVPVPQPRTNIFQGIVNLFRSQSQHGNQVEQAPTPDKTVDKATEPKSAPKTPTRHKKLSHASSSATWEISESQSPDLLKDLEDKLASTQHGKTQDNSTALSEARHHSPELGDENTTIDSRRPGGAHDPFVIEADDEPAVKAPPKPVKNGASPTNQEDEPDDVQLVDTSQLNTRIDPQADSHVATARVSPQDEAQKSVESRNGPDNPPEIPGSSPESKKVDKKRQRQVTPHPNFVHTKKKDQTSSTSSSRADRTHGNRPLDSSSKKRKADSEVDGERGPRSHSRSSHVDAADEAIIGNRSEPLLGPAGRYGGKKGNSLAGGMGNGLVGGIYKKLSTP